MSELVCPRVVDYPAPVLPAPTVIVDYVPFIRIITAAEQVISAVTSAPGEAGRGSKRVTRATANVYRPKLSWRGGEARQILASGFPE